MGSVFRKTYTKPMPADAEVTVKKGKKVARWRDSKGKLRTAEVTTGIDGSPRLLIESSFYVAKYRDGNGHVQEESTGCKDEVAARQVLAKLERRAELVRSGVISSVEAEVGDHQSTALAVHLDAFIVNLQNADRGEKLQKERRSDLKKIFDGCGWKRLSDLNRDQAEKWLAGLTEKKKSARTRNAYREALVAFANWCVDADRLTANPFQRIPKADEKADPRHKRRAMTEEELVRFLDAARRRPLIDATTFKRGKRKGQQGAELKSGAREAMEALGRERALIYKTLILTGLRKGELASLTVAQLSLEGSKAFAELDASDEKNREGNSIVIRADLAEDLRVWLADKLTALQEVARKRDEPIPLRLPPDTLIFHIPHDLSKSLTKDLKLAGIPKRDDRNRVLDVHALRTTFGTLMSKAGVAPRTAQAAMRHKTLAMTMNVYTDPRLLDVAGAVETLPELPLNGCKKPDRAEKKGGKQSNQS